MTRPPRLDRNARSAAHALPRLPGNGLLGFGIVATLLVALLALNAMRDPSFVSLQTPATAAEPASAGE